VLLEAVSLQDFRARSSGACNCLKIVVSPVRVRVSPSAQRLDLLLSGVSSEASKRRRRAGLLRRIACCHTRVVAISRFEDAL
jgi:hypothetical protein